MNFLDDSFQLHYSLETEAGSVFVFVTVSQEDLVSREEHDKYVPLSLCTLQDAGWRGKHRFPLFILAAGYVLLDDM